MKYSKSSFIAGLFLTTVFMLLVAFATTAFAAAGAPANVRKKGSSGTAAARKAKAADRAVLNPEALIAARASKILADLKSRPVRAVATDRSQDVTASPSKGSWLDAIYDKNMIETSWGAAMLADKRLLAEVLEREMGGRATRFYPKTVGLREFLYKHKMIDNKGRLTASGDEIEQALHDEFPTGYVVRPAVGIAPQETARGLFPDTDQFIVQLLRGESPYYSPSHMMQPVKSHILNTIASGEAVVLQENVVLASDVVKPLKMHYFQEVRVHTYEGHVVDGAVPERWVQKNLLTPEQVHRAESFVGEFLNNLSLPFLTKQAWGVDVAVMDNGEMRIIDIVTNRGLNIAWSSYLEQPRVIAAYSKLFEERYGLRFAGLDGALIRHGFANYIPFWEKRIEKARPGLGKALAYLPPVP